MHPMLKALYARNRKRGFMRAEKSASDDSATLYLYDMIVDTDEEAEWWGGVSPESFTQSLRALDAETIHLRVNSPGGSVFAARAMEQAIREHPSRIVTHVDGLAASAASFLILPSAEIVMAPGAFIMIHNAWTFAWGNKADLRKTADLLDQVDTSLVKSYAAKSGQSTDDIAAWMSAETWLEADRAVELHFADRVADEKAADEGDKKAADKAAARAQASARKLAATWDLSAFAHAPAMPAAAAQAAPPPTTTTDPEPDRAAMHRAVLKALIPA